MALSKKLVLDVWLTIKHVFSVDQGKGVIQGFSTNKKKKYYRGNTIKYCSDIPFQTMLKKGIHL